MKVRELIEALKQANPEQQVWTGQGKEIEGIERGFIPKELALTYPAGREVVVLLVK